MADRFQPIPQYGGALQPPGRRPPTAVGVATPPPLPNRRRAVRTMPAGSLRQALDAGLRAVRQVAGTVGRVVAGLREHRASHGRA